MNKKTTTVRVKKIGIMTVSARAASKEIGAADSRFCAAIFLTDDTRKTAGEYLADKIAELVKGGDRAKALEVARLTRPFTRRTAAILAARDIEAVILSSNDAIMRITDNFKLADTIAAEVAAAEAAERPYIEKEQARAKIRAEKAAARKAEREAAKITEHEEEILAAARSIQARREAEAAAKAAA